MAITSFEFLLFIFVIFIIYFILPQKIKPLYLLAGSLFFYFCWAKWAPFFMVLYGLFIYWAAWMITKQTIRRFAFLTAFCGICIALFCVLRYTDLPDRFINALVFPFDISISIIFPLGFSYYMFKSISYLCDVYFEKLAPEKRFDFLLLHLCFFSEITMGPITRAIDFLPQIRTKKIFDEKVFIQCFILILWGYFKKMVLADRLAVLVGAQFNIMEVQNGLAWLVLSFSALIQLYLEFSAYTDISVAISGILGYKIKHNFKAPFLAQTVSEFWRSWHISFSSWLSDYVFSLLQFKWRQYGIYASVLAAIVTLTLAGLWHSIEMKFFIYGVLMGIFIAIDAVFAKKRKSLKKKLPKSFFVFSGILITLLINSVLFVFVRADGASNALIIIGNYMFNPMTWSFQVSLGNKMWVLLFVCMIATACSHWLELHREQFFKKYFRMPLIVRWSFCFALIFSIILFQVGGKDLIEGFMYANF